MALAVDSEQATNVGFGFIGNTTPQTFSFTNTAGTVLYLIVTLGCGGAETSSFGAVSYGGAAMTKIAEVTTSGGATGGRVGLFRLLSPATGSNTVSIAYTYPSTASNSMSAGCISFTGNNVTTPEAQAAGTNTGSSASASINLAGVAAGNITVAGFGGGTHFTTQSATLSWAKNNNDSSSLGNGRAARSASTGSVTQTATLAGSDSWASLMVEVAAAGGGGAAPEELSLTLTGAGV